MSRIVPLACALSLAIGLSFIFVRAPHPRGWEGYYLFAKGVEPSTSRPRSSRRRWSRSRSDEASTWSRRNRNSTSALTAFALPSACPPALGICEGRSRLIASYELTAGVAFERKDI